MSQIRKLFTRKRVALVAHDNKKKDLIDWAIYNKTVLSRHELIATGTTPSGPLNNFITLSCG